jgi:hypothetical protein
MKKFEKYFGTKEIEACEMNYGEYADFKYGDKKINTGLPDNKKGYSVRYSDDYLSWSPEEPFKAYKKINGNLTRLRNELLTEEHTYIEHDENQYNAPHNYLIKNIENDNLLCGIHFQCGPVKEKELNGVFLPDIIGICIDVLENFQDSEFKCNENDIALDGLKAAITALRSRTNKRKERGVHGTYEK